MVILVMTALYPTAGRAQFLKNLVNNAKQNIANKVGGNNPNTTGKPDSAANAKGYDSTMVAGIMSRAAKPVAMTAADSASAAAAVKEFMTATGGSGILYQYQIRYNLRIKGKDSVFVDTMSTAISDNRYTHVDMGMLGMKMSIIGRADQPRYSVMLYPETKSYKLNVIDTARLNNAGGQAYQVAKVGAETVAGYSCTHARMTVIGGDKKVVMTDELWICPTVLGYAQMKQYMSNAHVTPKMLQALSQAGCDGFIVKMTGQSPQTTGQSPQMTMQMQLVTAARKTFPASLFEIPAGYMAANNASMFNNMLLGQQKAK
jgi:hypothetical protein